MKAHKYWAIGAAVAMDMYVVSRFLRDAGAISLACPADSFKRVIEIG